MRETHEMAGKTVKISLLVDGIGGQNFRIEDWWSNVAGKSWMVCRGNPACLAYAMRTGCCEYNVPTDDEVVYGKTNDGLGHLLHVSEIENSTR